MSVEGCLSAARRVKPAVAADAHTCAVVGKCRQSGGRYRRLRKEPGYIGEAVVGEVDGAQFPEQFSFRVVMPPAAGLKKFDQMGFTALYQREPFARDRVVRTCLLDRHGSPNARDIETASIFGTLTSASNRNECCGAAASAALHLLWITV